MLANFMVRAELRSHAQLWPWATRPMPDLVADWNRSSVRASYAPPCKPSSLRLRHQFMCSTLVVAASCAIHMVEPDCVRGGARHLDSHPTTLATRPNNQLQGSHTRTQLDHLIMDLVRVDGRFKPGLVNMQQYVFEGLGGGREPMSTTMKVCVFICVRMTQTVRASVYVCFCVLEDMHLQGVPPRCDANGYAWVGSHVLRLWRSCFYKGIRGPPGAAVLVQGLIIHQENK